MKIPIIIKKICNGIGSQMVLVTVQASQSKEDTWKGPKRPINTKGTKLYIYIKI